MDAGALAAEFWRRMNTNDWSHAAALFADGFVLDWPQSSERIVGRENFVAVNAAYPAEGRWAFTVRNLVAAENRAVTETFVTDGAMQAVAVTFFEIFDGRIDRMREFWPDPYAGPAWRSRWVQRLA